MNVPRTDEEMRSHLQWVHIRSEEITDNGLTVDRSPEELLGAVRKITKLEDKEIESVQQIVAERAQRGEIENIACSMGCWHCCTQLVAVTVPEVLRISEHIRAEWTPEQRRELDARLAAHQEASRAFLEGATTLKPRAVCPLLVDAACSVWKVRPIVCRGYNSTDVGACIRRREHPEAEEDLIPSITGQLYLSFAARNGMRGGLKKHGLDESLHELISTLAIALAVPDAADRYLAGEPLFESTRLSTGEN